MASGLIELDDSAELALDVLLVLEGVQGLEMRLELPTLFRRHLRRIEEPLIGGGRRFVAAVDLGSFAMLFEQLDGGWEEVLQVAPAVVEVVDGGHGLGVVDPVVAQQLAHVGPVRMFDVGVVVLAVLAGPGSSPRVACAAGAMRAGAS